MVVGGDDGDDGIGEVVRQLETPAPHRFSAGAVWLCAPPLW